MVVPDTAEALYRLGSVPSIHGVYKGLPRPWPVSLRVLRDRYGADVCILGGMGSQTETRRGQVVLRASTAYLLATGRRALPGRKGLPLAGHQVCYRGNDPQDFRQFCRDLNGHVR